MSSKKKTERVSVELDRELLRVVAAEMARMKKAPGRASKAGAIKAILRRQLRGNAATRSGRERAYREILAELEPLKQEARQLLSAGYTTKSRAVFLEAVVLELEALKLLDDPTEETMKSTLIEVVGLLKDATGYRHLPDVPRPRRWADTPSV